MANSTLRKRPLRIRRFDHSFAPGPKPTTIKTILDYSKALRVVDAPPIGKIDLVLN